MADAGGEIGSVKVRVTADTSQLTAGLNDAKAQTTAASGSMSDSWVALGKTLKTARSHIFGVVSALSGIVAGISLVVTAVGALLAIFAEMATRTARLRRNFLDLQEQIRKTFADKPEGFAKTLADLDDQLEETLKKIRESDTSAQGKQAAFDEARFRHREAREREINSEVGAQMIDNQEKAAKRAAELQEKFLDAEERRSRTRQAIDQDQQDQFEALRQWNNDEDERVSKLRELNKELAADIKQAVKEAATEALDKQRQFTNSQVDRIATDVTRLVAIGELRQVPR